MTPNEVWEKFEGYRELVGDTHALDSLAKAIGTAELEDTLRFVDRMEETNLFEGDEDE